MQHRRNGDGYGAYAFFHNAPERGLCETYESRPLRHRCGFLSQRRLFLGSGKSGTTTRVLGLQRVDWVDESVGALWNTTVGKEPWRRNVLQFCDCLDPRSPILACGAPHLRMHDFRALLTCWSSACRFSVRLGRFRELNSRIEVHPTVWRPQPGPGSEIPPRIGRGPAQAGLRLRRPGRCQPKAEQDSSRCAAPTTAPTALGRD